MFTENERKTLTLYCRVCNSITSCRFIRELQNQDHSIKIAQNPLENHIPQYDKDDFRSFLTVFRKLDANNEPTNIYKVMKILGRCISDEERIVLKRFKKQLHVELEKPPLAMAIGTLDSMNGYSPKRIRNIMFNAEVFHTDSELQDDLSTIMDYEPFAMASFLRYATFLIKHAVQFARVIQERGFLKE